MKMKTISIIAHGIDVPVGNYCAKFNKINHNENCLYECEFLMGHYCLPFKRVIEEKGKYYLKCDKCLSSKVIEEKE